MAVCVIIINMEFNLPEIVAYWETTAKRDIKTAESLFASKRFPEALFFGHLCLEKALKGLIVLHTRGPAPYIHNLSELEKLADTKLSQEQIDFLDLVTGFNISARYPEWKLEFYKKCTPEFTSRNLTKIKELFVIVCQTLEQRKK